MEQLIEFLSRDTIQLMVNFVSYGIISFAGAIIKELNDTDKRKNHQFDPLNVIIGTVVATLISIVVRQKFSDILDQYWGFMGTASFILGLLGYEIYRYISTLAGIKKTIKTINHVAEEGIIDNLIPDESEEKQPVVKKQQQQCCDHTIADHVVHIHDPSLKYNIRRPVIHTPNDPNRIEGDD